MCRKETSLTDRIKKNIRETANKDEQEHEAHRCFNIKHVKFWIFFLHNGGQRLGLCGLKWTDVAWEIPGETAAGNTKWIPDSIPVEDAEWTAGLGAGGIEGGV